MAAGTARLERLLPLRLADRGCNVPAQAGSELGGIAIDQGSRRVPRNGERIALSRKAEAKYRVIHRAETGITAGVPAEQAGDRTKRRRHLRVADVPELQGSLARHGERLAVRREFDAQHVQLRGNDAEIPRVPRIVMSQSVTASSPPLATASRWLSGFTSSSLPTVVDRVASLRTRPRATSNRTRSEVWGPGSIVVVATRKVPAEIALSRRPLPGSTEVPRLTGCAGLLMSHHWILLPVTWKAVWPSGGLSGGPTTELADQGLRVACGARFPR